MLLDWWKVIVDNIVEKIMLNIDLYAPRIVGSITILLFWILIAILVYELIMYIFKKFKIIELINRLEDKMNLNLWWDNPESITLDSETTKVHEKRKIKIIHRKRLTERINVDIIISKAFAYYVLIIFFRLSIVVIWITDVEIFLSDVISYLPNLFIAVLIWFFWVRFSNTVYDVVYYTLELTKHQTSKIIAMWSKVVILFFTIMIVLNYIKIVDQFIIYTIFIWFISTITIWAWIAFWLGWKEVAREILESFRK